MKRILPWLCLLLTVAGLAAIARPTSAHSAAPLAGAKICLDPGHGGSDPGAVNAAAGLHESDINLDISYALKYLLEAAGATVTMVRADDVTRTNTERNDFCNREEASFVISVHTNSVSTPEPNGSLVLYDNDADLKLAQAIYDVLYPTLSVGMTADEFFPFGTRRYRASILRRTNMPGALIEPAFLSNTAEAARLTQPIYADAPHAILAPACAQLECRRGQIAWAVYQGILNYVVADATPTPQPTWTPAATPTPALPTPRPRHESLPPE